MIEIIADSTCDLTQEELDQYGIHLLPLHILMGENEYKDGPSFDMQTMYDWVRRQPIDAEDFCTIARGHDRFAQTHS